MKKEVLDLKVRGYSRFGNKFLLKLQSATSLPKMLPGQFAELRVDHTAGVLLRRPISINYVDTETNEIWFLVQQVGPGTRGLANLKEGDTVNVVLPLGNGFTLPVDKNKKVLLVGGGVGTAPLLYLAHELKAMGLDEKQITFLFGARTFNDLTEIEEFKKYGSVYITTEDGSMGEKGLVTQHSVLNTLTLDWIYVCGPTPMMKAVAKYAHKNEISCEVSLENKMACGLGACLCCVESTPKGNLCVCKEGPVFNINQLSWQL